MTFDAVGSEYPFSSLRSGETRQYRTNEIHLLVRRQVRIYEAQQKEKGTGKCMSKEILKMARHIDFSPCSVELGVCYLKPNYLAYLKHKRLVHDFGVHMHQISNLQQIANGALNSAFKPRGKHSNKPLIKDNYSHYARNQYLLKDIFITCPAD